MNPKRTMAGLLAASSIFVVGLAGPAAAASSSVPSAEPARDNAACVNGTWPGAVDGRPTQLQVGADAAVYLWHDSTGWHLRATHAGTGKQVITGKITSDGAIYGVARRTEKKDRVSHTASRHTITFRFTNYGGIDGLDFKVRCGKHLRFNGQLDKKQLAPEQVWMGTSNQHPEKVPFQITRVKSSSSS